MASAFGRLGRLRPGDKPTERDGGPRPSAAVEEIVRRGRRSGEVGYDLDIGRRRRGRVAEWEADLDAGRSQAEEHGDGHRGRDEEDSRRRQLGLHALFVGESAVRHQRALERGPIPSLRMCPYRGFSYLPFDGRFRAALQ